MEDMSGWDNNTFQVEWAKARADEREAKERRSAIEEEMVKRQAVPEGYVGRKTTGGLSALYRRRYMVLDSSELQADANNQSLIYLLRTAFVWKASVVVNVWEATPEKVRHKLCSSVAEDFPRPTWRLSQSVNLERDKMGHKPRKLEVAK